MTDLIQTDTSAPRELAAAHAVQDVLMLPTPHVATAPYTVCVQAVKVAHHKLEARFSLSPTSQLYRNIGWALTSKRPEYPSAYIEFTFLGTEYPISHLTAKNPSTLWFGSVNEGQQVVSCIARHGDYHFMVHGDKLSNALFDIDPIIVVTIPPLNR